MKPDEVARQWFREVWDDGREDASERLMAPNAVAQGLGEAPLTGPDEFKPIFRMFREALGDLRIEVARTVVEGEMVAVHCRVRGKRVGNAFGAPQPGGRSNSGA